MKGSKRSQLPRQVSRATEKKRSRRIRNSGQGGSSPLVETARMRWQFGDWENLVSLDRQAIAGDPERGTLALLMASAHLQLGDQGSARVWVEDALEWGCDKKMMARVLIAGTHNTLGRIAAVRRQEIRALNHFRNAVDGVGGDERLASQARSIAEIAKLNLVDQAISVMKMERAPGMAAPPDALEVHRADKLRSHLLGGPDSGKPGGKARRAIVIAGMRHSGSTALFNIVRLALERQQVEFVSLYSEGVRSEHLDDPDAPLLLIKTHEFRDDVAAQADVVITTRRDLRDTVASAKRRKFPVFERLGSTVEYAKYNRALHDIWREHSNYEFVYESYMASPLAETDRLLRFLGLGEVDVEAIHEAVASLPHDQYHTSLLSPTHITDPERLLTFEDTLSEADLARINSEHSSWLKRYGYQQ